MPGRRPTVRDLVQPFLADDEQPEFVFIAWGRNPRTVVLLAVGCFIAVAVGLGAIGASIRPGVVGVLAGALCLVLYPIVLPMRYVVATERRLAVLSAGPWLIRRPRRMLEAVPRRETYLGGTEKTQAITVGSQRLYPSKVFLPLIAQIDAQTASGSQPGQAEQRGQAEQPGQAGQSAAD